MFRLSLCLIALIVCIAEAHICILQPKQRGPLSIVSPGDDSCYRRTDYCGGIQPADPTQTYQTGTSSTIFFQQNLNHFYPPKPGFFDISISYNAIQSTSSLSSDEIDWIVLTQFNDFAAHDMVVQTNFTVSVTWPNQPCAHCVLRLRYVSYNPLEIDPTNNTDAIFYNCADITLVSPSTEASTTEAPIDSLKFETNSLSELSWLKQNSNNIINNNNKNNVNALPSCCTGPSWQAFGVETTANGKVFHNIYYDKVLNAVRWDRMGLTLLTLITNYTTTAEYVFYPSTNKCYVYGADKFYDWCYGGVAGQTLVSNTTFQNYAPMQMWEVDSPAFSWTSIQKEDGNCYPFSTHHGDSTILFYGVTLGISDPALFLPPDACKSAEQHFASAPRRPCRRNE